MVLRCAARVACCFARVAKAIPVMIQMVFTRSGYPRIATFRVSGIAVTLVGRLLKTRRVVASYLNERMMVEGIVGRQSGGRWAKAYPPVHAQLVSGLVVPLSALSDTACRSRVPRPLQRDGLQFFGKMELFSGTRIASPEDP